MQMRNFARRGIWLDFSRSDYESMCRIQAVLHQKRHQNTIPDVAILLEHSPCITIGSSGGYNNILADNTLLKKLGISVHETTRGGNITYHGPGQLVCYPIMALTQDERDLHAYARKMEEVMIQTLLAFGIQAGRKPQFPGVWVADAKIGAMGIAVRKWTTMHGISLNVCPDMRHFDLIVPCGIAAHGVTSMQRVLGRPIDVEEVKEKMRSKFCEIFEIAMTSGQLDHLIKEDICETA